MRVNEETVLVGEKVVLVPYRPEHVPKYHSWMMDEELRRLTASEPLSLEEEYEMQQKWQLDEDKLTFIILHKDNGVDFSSEETIHPSDPRISQLQMVGDVNVFLHGTFPSLEENDYTKDGQDENKEENKPEAEVEIMIAEPMHRRQGLAYEALKLMFSYTTGTPFGIPAKYLVTRITESNLPSIKLFEKLGFEITRRVSIFGEVEMKYKRAN